MLSIEKRIAQELAVNPHQIEAAIKLLNEGATIPFIARYRKEETDGLTDEQLREFQTRYTYLTELEERKVSILSSIREQGKLTLELEEEINKCLVKADLEYLYIPYRPKRKTKASKAREAGLEPLAISLWENLDVNVDLEQACAPYISDDYKTTKAVLEACALILIDNFADKAELLADLKNYLQAVATIESRVIEGKEKEADKYKDYFNYSETLCDIRSHRFLALWRGRSEGFLSIHLNANPANIAVSPVDTLIQKHAVGQTGIDLVPVTALNSWRKQVLSWTWKVKLSSILETELLNARREAAEPDAYNSFSQNLKALLLKSPVKAQNILGLDPGILTGVKCAAIDAQTNVLDTQVIIPIEGKQRAKEQFAQMIIKHAITLVVIGNGTGCRETQKIIEDTLKEYNLPHVSILVVNEAGASVYSASDLAISEFPNLDVTLRGAISIARRALDPLAELVKIDPKSIGVGQYQHDLNKKELDRQLEATIEDCVNYVGVNVNTASEYLLNRIAGLNKVTAGNIVKFREENGHFASRKDLLRVPKLGPKTFEQAAGFLRVVGENAYVLDNSAVHPEAYTLVEQMAVDLGVNIIDLVGNKELLTKIQPETYVSKKFGLPTIKDILVELEKPGRDPRGEFQPILYKEGVHDVKDLAVGMRLNGMVTNVTDFGAFVDIGVHTDGLVHISRMSKNFIASTYDFLKPGDQIEVEVLEVDVPRNRVELTMIFEGQTLQPTVKTVSEVKSTEEAQRIAQVLKEQQAYAELAKEQGIELDPKTFRLFAQAQKRRAERSQDRRQDNRNQGGKREDRAANAPRNHARQHEGRKEFKGNKDFKGNNKNFKGQVPNKGQNKAQNKPHPQRLEDKFAALLNKFKK
ncbi:Tex family protein [Psittacicella hinzii]|uniref:S1 motif domain-containing protein n=1 Tax=Psittacicella hinzii TaxID=2028575 RepID=A0A3A1YFT7_9GAMM|nr:Tex family protein [Psittacicella hinzii]RIY37113.1 hypothetical protein CKF58_05300 [Psittacicella hinzii]